MAINKVKYGNQTLIDLSTDTVSSAEHILLGKVGHLRDGTVVTGTASGGDQHGTIWQDGQGNVHLDDESGIALQSKTATPSESQQVIEADEGYYALDKVTVGAISSSYVGSGVARRSSSDLTASGATVTVPAGYYASQASKAVASGTAGTPTATKGTVSNHAVTVTPSVTNTTGYISGGTKTGTAVTVTASELVSGTKSITENGTGIDVSTYASVNVNVPSDDFVITFTQNQSGDWIPDCTFTEFSNAYNAGKTIGARTSGGFQPTVSVYDDGVWVVAVSDWFEDGEGDLWYQAIKTKFYSWSPTGLSFSYEDVTYFTDTADAVPSDVANGKIFFNSQGVQIGTASGGGGTSGVVEGTFTVASTISTTTDVVITSTTEIGFTPTKFIFMKDSQAVTTNAVNMCERIVNGGRSQRIRTTLTSNNTLSVGSNTSDWTSMSAGHISFNSSTGAIYIRVTSSYILEADTYTWIAIQ